MRMSDRVKGALRGWNLGLKKLDPRVWTSNNVALRQANANWQDASSLWRDMTELEKSRVMNDCVAVFACVRKIANGVTKGALKVGRKKPDGQWMDSPNHPMLTLMCRPNPDMTGAEFHHRVVAHLVCAGRMHVWKWRLGKGAPAELWPMPPSWVFPRPMESLKDGKDKRRLISHYDIKIPGGPEFKNIMPRDMITRWYADPFSLTGVLPPLQGAMRDVQLTTRHDDYEIETVGNMRPTPVIKTQDAIGEDQKRDLKRMLRSFMGWDNMREAMTISGEEVAAELWDVLKDKDWHAFRNLRDANVCAALGVPPVVAGLVVGLENSPWSNMGEAKKWFFEETIIPQWIMLQDGWTDGLMRVEGEPRLEFYYDHTEVEDLQESKDSQANRMRDAWESGACTRNAYLQALGLDPDSKRGEFYKLRIGEQEVPANEEPEEPEPMMAPDEHEEGAQELETKPEGGADGDTE